MPRNPRHFAPGGAYHLTARAVAGASLFPEVFDRLAFLVLLEKTGRRVGWQVAAWCLLDTHYHLIVFAGAEPDVSLGMQMLNGLHARGVNQRYDRRGHLFGERFRPTPVESEEHLTAAIAYVLRNPVRAGLVKRVEAWRWSGTTTLGPREILDRISTRS